MECSKEIVGFEQRYNQVFLSMVEIYPHGSRTHDIPEFVYGKYYHVTFEESPRSLNINAPEINEGIITPTAPLGERRASKFYGHNNLVLLAFTKKMENIYLFLVEKIHPNIRETPFTNFPLYLGWGYLSPEFFRRLEVG